MAGGDRESREARQLPVGPASTDPDSILEPAREGKGIAEVTITLSVLTAPRWHFTPKMAWKSTQASISCIGPHLALCCSIKLLFEEYFLEVQSFVH